MPLGTTRFNILDHLKTPEGRLRGGRSRFYHSCTRRCGARARHDQRRQGGWRHPRSALQALSEKGDPKLSTLLGVMEALGIQLSAKPADGFKETGQAEDLDQELQQ